MTVTEKVAYLKGLVEGLDIDEGTKEGRVFKAIIEVLEDVALTVTDLEDGLSEISEQVDAIDEDLEDIEKDFYGDDDDDDDDDDDADYYEVTCPKCGDKVCLDDELISEGEINCPKCGEKLEFDFGCDCGCEHDEDEEE